MSDDTRGELRSMPVPFIDPDGRTVTGYAIRYGERSMPLPFAGGSSFIEVIERGAASDVLRSGSEVVALFEHRPPVLGRTSKGTLKLSEDEHGVRYSLSLPDTQLGRDIAEMLRRGDLAGSSFYLDHAKGDAKWTRSADGTPIKSVSRLRSLPEITLTGMPAYPTTTASLRSLQEWEADQAAPESRVPLTVRQRQAYVAGL